MAGDFRLVFDEGSKFRKEVKRWKKNLVNLKWIWPWVTDGIEKHHLQVFNREGAHGRLTGWKPLAHKTTVARFFRHPVPGSYTDAYRSASPEGADHRILHWSHALRRAMTRRRALGAVRKFKAKGMEYGTDLPHAADHQYGTSKPIGAGGKTRVIPARPFLDDRGTYPVIGKRMHHGIMKMLNGQWRGV